MEISCKWKYVKLSVHYVIDIFLFVLLLPIIIFLMVPIFIIGIIKEKNLTVIFAGLEHVIHKTLLRGEYFKNKQHEVMYYSFEKTNNSITYDNVIEINRFTIVDILIFTLKVIKTSPCYLEVYFEKSGIRQLFYVIIARINGTFVSSIYRGGELRYYVKGKKKIKTYLCFLSANFSNIILYRELYMEKYLKKYIYLHNNIIHDYNKVKVSKLDSYSNDNYNVLFLNSFKELRRLDVALKAFKIIKVKYPKAKLYAVGALNERSFNNMKNLSETLNLSDSVFIHKWTSDPIKYYEKCSIFVLPADLIYCNFSLLEAMERGIPAIVSDVHDADKIIKHGVNGFIAKQNPEDFAKYIDILLNNVELRLEMGKEARKTIVNYFNHEDRMNKLYNIIKKMS